MSRTRVYNNDTLNIMSRYFEAIRESKKLRRIKTVQQFCIDNGIDPPHFYMQRKDLHRGFFEVGWLIPLIRDCGVSPTWLLTGVGPMYNY